MKFAIAALIGSTTCVKLQDPIAWEKDTLPKCPDNKSPTMDQGRIHVVKYPMVGATCQVQIPQEDVTLTLYSPEFVMTAPPSFDPKSVEHCPDFDERWTLTDGRT